ncbi:MAG: hypothetical protein ACLGIE_11340 [Alphaproteobacteria bacterium]
MDEFNEALRKAGESVYAEWLEKVGADGQAILDEYNSRRAK